MVLDNDTRGWIMAVVGGIACTVGASIICVDLIIRRFPGKRKFKIEDSNTFLSCGLSLSFGVMIFSSLYSMLPHARQYLQTGGMESKPATFTLIGCFLLGAVGISIASRILHSFIPHSVVDCDHEHDDEEEGKVDDESDDTLTVTGNGDIPDADQRPMEEQWRRHSTADDERRGLQPFNAYGSMEHSQELQQGPLTRRPSLQTQISAKVSQLVSGTMDTCSGDGQCFGFSDRACGTECFRNIARGPRVHSSIPRLPTRPIVRTNIMPHERQPLLQDVDETTVLTPLSPTLSGPAALDHVADISNGNGHSPSLHKQPSAPSLPSSSSCSSVHSLAHSHEPHPNGHAHAQHHHHVPTNVFYSIGLQTVIAIALHKIPEGFITYATNHVNPTLGFAVFLALFIHNITEGFAMALPLYLAINSRWKAMFWSALLGGVSQPLGAGVAALWFRLAKRGKDGDGAEPGEKVYGVLFALTSGIMAMVALQLFGESLELTHSRRLCFASAFVGMGILGLSSALTA